MSSQGREQPRIKRPFLNKVKSGCLTCKRRKVKCDEYKPECRRCTTTGRSCAGYAPVVTRQPPRFRAAPDVSYGPSTWLTTDLEKRSFDLFVTRAARRLGGFFHAAFWSREVLQAAISDPCIRHLIVALGAAYELFERHRPSSPLPAGDGGVEVQFALQQCNRAIRLLSQPGPRAEEEPLQIPMRALTASILFTAFAAMQGDLAQAFNHVRSGLKVLQDLEADQRRPTASVFPIPLASLRVLLVSFYAQIRAMTSDDTWQQWRRDPLDSDIKPPTCFPTLADAQESVEELFCNMLGYLQSSHLRTPAETSEKHAHLVRTLQASRTALDAFAANQDRNSLDQTASSIAVLRLYQAHIAIRLEVALKKEREEAFDALEPLFVQMLGYAQVAIQTRPDPDSAPPVYSSGLGVVMPLHMIAARCRNLAVRMAAVEMLCRAERRDGLWDSAIAGKIASTTIDLEREARVTSARRVTEVKIKFEKDRGARFDFITVEGSKTTNEPACQRNIEW